MREGKASFKGRCREIVKKLIKLKYSNIKYSITPKFPYDFDFIEKN